MNTKFVQNFVLVLFLFPALNACVSGGKRLTELELAATHLPALERLCRDGVSGACALQGKEIVLSRQYPVMQGVSSNRQARFAVVVPKDEKFVYYARSEDDLIRLKSQRVSRDSSPSAVDHVDAFDLDPKKSYQLVMIDQYGMAADRRNFSSLDLAKTKPRIAMISCMDDSLTSEQRQMWTQLLGEKPDAIMMIGDNVYADRIPGGWKVASPDQLWDRYVDTRGILEFFKSPNLIPVFATWDDHDYGRNDSDRTYEFKEPSREIFQAFFPQEKPAVGFEPGPGVASRWTAYGARFLLLDNRFFRSPNKIASPDETHFGIEQEDWIWNSLSESTGPVFLISGDQFFGGYMPFESYEGSHPNSFKAQLSRWKKAKPPIVFMSGDRHLTEIMEIPRSVLGYSTFELTSSPLHAKVFADAFQKAPSPKQIAGVAGKYNYMIIELGKLNSKSLQMNVRSMGIEKTKLFEKNLTVKK